MLLQAVPNHEPSITVGGFEPALLAVVAQQPVGGVGDAIAAATNAGLLEAVDYLNRRMEEIRDQGKIVGLERIAIMAALNITHEFLGAKVGDGFDMAGFKRKMTSMETVIDQALSEQSKLF